MSELELIAVIRDRISADKRTYRRLDAIRQNLYTQAARCFAMCMAGIPPKARVAVGPGRGRFALEHSVTLADARPYSHRLHLPRSH